MHHQAARYLRELPDDIFYTCIPGGDGRATRSAGYYAGAPDFVLCKDGKSIFIELKRPGKLGRLSKNQKNAHERIRAAGGDIWIVRVLDELDAVLKYYNITLKNNMRLS